MTKEVCNIIEQLLFVTNNAALSLLPYCFADEKEQNAPKTQIADPAKDGGQNGANTPHDSLNDTENKE